MSQTKIDNRARRYIRILNDEMWELIDKLAALEKYKKSFNLLINDALACGLPELVTLIV